MQSYSFVPYRLSFHSQKNLSYHQKKFDKELKVSYYSPSDSEKRSSIGLLRVISSIVGFNMVVPIEVALPTTLSPSYNVSKWYQDINTWGWFE